MDGRAREGELLLVYCRGAACAFIIVEFYTKCSPRDPGKKEDSVSSITCAEPAPSHHILRCIEKIT